MVKNIARFLVLCVTLALLLLFSFKDVIAKKMITKVFRQQIAENFSVDEARVWPNNIALKGVVFSNKALSFKADSLSFRFWFTKRLEPYLTSITLDDSQIKVTDLRKPAVPGITKSQAAAVSTPTIIMPRKAVSINLNDVSVKYKNQDIDVDFISSCNAILYDEGVIRIHNIDLRNFNIRQQNFNVKDLSIVRVEPNRYTITIPSLSVFDKEVINLIVPVSMKGDRLTLEKAGNRFFGPEAFFEGSIDFGDYRNICFSVNFHNCSFEKIFRSLFRDQNILVQGAYGGKLLCCLSGSDISDIEGYFYDTAGGAINISDKKEASSTKRIANFLSSLPVAGPDMSKSFLDSIKDYNYNKSKITLRQEKNDLIVDMHFESQKMGERNVTFHYHDILGGLQ